MEDTTSNTSNTLKIYNIKSSDDIDINGILYFIPDKYISNTCTYLSTECKQLYKFIIAMYLDLLISTHKIDNIIQITLLHMNESIKTADKLICYITTGCLYISYITNIEKQILNRIPEALIVKHNPTIIEKIDA